MRTARLLEALGTAGIMLVAGDTNACTTVCFTDCGRPVRMLDIDAQLDGEVGGRFEAYSTAANLDLIRRSFRKTPFLAQVGQARMEALARHPDSARCAPTGSSPR